MQQFRADQLQPGDLIDLEGDLYADPDSTKTLWKWSYGCVMEAEGHPADPSVVVDLVNGETLIFPRDHLLSIIRPLPEEAEDWLLNTSAVARSAAAAHEDSLDISRWSDDKLRRELSLAYRETSTSSPEWLTALKHEAARRYGAEEAQGQPDIVSSTDEAHAAAVMAELRAAELPLPPQQSFEDL